MGATTMMPSTTGITQVRAGPVKKAHSISSSAARQAQTILLNFISNLQRC